MNYIAVKNEHFIILTGSEDEQELINQGYTLMTESQYEEYLEDMNQGPLNQLIIDLESKSHEYFHFGKVVFEDIKSKVWALNLYNRSIGNDITTSQIRSLLTTSDELEKALKSGSYITAIEILNELITTFPIYEEIAEEAIDKLNGFMGG